MYLNKQINIEKVTYIKMKYLFTYCGMQINKPFVKTENIDRILNYNDERYNSCHWQIQMKKATPL